MTLQLPIVNLLNFFAVRAGFFIFLYGFIRLKCLLTFTLRGSSAYCIAQFSWIHFSIVVPVSLWWFWLMHLCVGSLAVQLTFVPHKDPHSCSGIVPGTAMYWRAPDLRFFLSRLVPYPCSGIHYVILRTLSSSSKSSLIVTELNLWGVTLDRTISRFFNFIEIAPFGFLHLRDSIPFVAPLRLLIFKSVLTCSCNTIQKSLMSTVSVLSLRPLPTFHKVVDSSCSRSHLM